MSTHSDRWKANSEAFGANLKRLREQNNISGTRLAEIVGVSRSYLHEIENGPKSSPSVFIAHDLAVALGTSIEELIGLPVNAESARAEIAKVKTSEVVTLRRRLERIRNLCSEEFQKETNEPNY